MEVKLVANGDGTLILEDKDGTRKRWDGTHEELLVYIVTKPNQFSIDDHKYRNLRDESVDYTFDLRFELRCTQGETEEEAVRWLLNRCADIPDVLEVYER